MKPFVVDEPEEAARAQPRADAARRWTDESLPLGARRQLLREEVQAVLQKKAALRTSDQPQASCQPDCGEATPEHPLPAARPDLQAGVRR